MWAPGVKSVSRRRAASLTTLGTHAAAIARPFIRRVVRHGLRGGVVLLVEYATGPRAEHGMIWSGVITRGVRCININRNYDLP